MYDGYVFLCTKESQQQCLSNRRYSCADQKIEPTEKIKEGSIIFLYNLEEKTLLGPFTALTPGGEELDAGTWRMDVDKHVPSEDLKVTWEALHILEDAPSQLPFLNPPKICKLTTSQTQRILDLLNKSKLLL